MPALSLRRQRAGDGADDEAKGDGARKEARRQAGREAGRYGTCARRLAVDRARRRTRSSGSGHADEAGRQRTAPRRGSDDGAGRAGEAPVRRREVGRRGDRALPRLQGRDGRRRGQQAARAVPPRDLALPPQVLSGRVRHLLGDRRQAEPPQVQRDAPLAREARDRPAGARRHRRARRQVQRRADRQVQQPEPARAVLAAELSARSVQVPEPPVRRLAPSLQQDRPPVEVLRPRAVLQRHLERPAPTLRPGRAVVPAHRRRDRPGHRGHRGRGSHARPRLPLDGADVLLGFGPPRRLQHPDHRQLQALGGGEVLEQGRPGQRVLARRALRGVVGLLHGRRLRPRARQRPHDRVPPTSRTATIRKRRFSRPSSTSRTASTTTRRRSSPSSRRSTSRCTTT